jgi:phage recombination protein Bet
MPDEKLPQTRAAAGAVNTVTLTEKDLSLAKSIVFPSSTNDEFQFFIFECLRRNVHPLDRLIYPVKRHDNATNEDRITFQVSIDYLRMESEASEDYAGMDEPEYGEWLTDHPEWAKVVVYRYIKRPDNTYERIGFSATAYWTEFYPGEKLGFMWRSKPRLMLAKVAEAQARRRAWPAKFRGLYADEEMQRPLDLELPSGSSSYSASVAETKQLVDKQYTLGGGGAQGKAPANAGGKTVNDTYKDELLAFCEKHKVDPVPIITQTTTFEDKEGKKVFFRGGVEELGKLTNKWAGSALKNLRDLAGKYNSTPEKCTEDPQTCAESSFVEEGGGMIAVCVNGTPCQFNKE